ncbi:glycoside hydrolase family 16 protein [Rhodococcus marinonascens]|uniref:glycoside hydrolase family 16 protein n=1 Tax=Rhodococcus marinonascens TaxID=38311 RepID=UPI000933BE9B|nr:glycoside hydrolase family 16 protein [Rhodococcus marinonascens]
MRRMRSAFLGIALTCLVALSPAIAVASPKNAGVGSNYPGYTVTASDEFDGPAGAAPNPRFWGYDLGGGGWGNNEQQVYTDSRENSRLDGNGRLVVEARRSGGGFTSARLVTRGKFDFTYGLVEARIQVPSGAGLHPAFWTLGNNIDRVGWPACGEIDILEVVGDGSRYSAGVHGPTAIGARWKRSMDGSIGTNLSAGFHDYALIKEPGRISVGIDGNIVGTFSAADLRPMEGWVFDAPAHLLLNVAVGGDWPGPVDSTTRFPAPMLVEWVRFSR